MSGCHWCSHVHSHINQQQKVATMMDTQHNLWGWGKGEGEINKKGLEGDLGKTGRLLRFNSYAAEGFQHSVAKRQLWCRKAIHLWREKPG